MVYGIRSYSELLGMTVKATLQGGEIKGPLLFPQSGL